MGREEYNLIRKWLYSYSAGEEIYRDYYKKNNNFLNLQKNRNYNSKLSMKKVNEELLKQMNTIPGLPSYDVFKMQLQNKNTKYDYRIFSDELISPSYDYGFFKHPRYTVATRHTHDYYELAYVLEGKVCQTIWAGASKQSLTLQEGAFILIPPTVSHEVSVNDESILLNLLIRKTACENALLRNLPDNSALVDFFRNALYSENPLYIILQTDNTIELQECFFDLLIENYGDGHYKRELANLKASILFLNILSRTNLSIDLYNKGMKDLDYIPAIISYMEQNYATTTPQKVADAFGFSRAHLGRMYKRYSGNTLQDSICAIRMRNAEVLLTQSNYSIQLIAQMVGYDDVTNFIRRFKSHQGQTPHQYRLTRQ